MCRNMCRVSSSIWAVVVGWFLVAALGGCGTEAEYHRADSVELRGGAEIAVPPAFNSFDGLPDEARDSGLDGVLDNGDGDSLPARAAEQPAQRKLIQTGNVELIVTDFDAFTSQLTNLVTQLDGFIAAENINSRQNERRRGTWTLRVAAEQFDPLFEQVQNLGNPLDARRDVQDVTREYIDLQARLTSQRLLEERILKLLERPEDKIEHVIEVERELSRIRSQIETIEGNLRFLSDRVALSTLTVVAQEQRDYQPAQAPTLTNRIENAWGTSVTNLRRFGENLLIALVAFAPWLPVWLVLLLILWLVIKTIRLAARRYAANAAAAESSGGTSA